MQLRNRAIYVNYIPEEQRFESPMNLTEGDVGLLSLEVNNVYNRTVFLIRDSDEKTVSDMRKVYRAFYSSIEDD